MHAYPRRAIFPLAALAASAALTVAGCAGKITVAKAAQYVQAAANAADDALKQIPEAPADLVKAVAALRAAAAAVAAGGDNPAISLVQQAYDAIKVILPIVAPFVSTIPGVGLALGALQALLPYIASAAGLVAVPLIAAAGAPRMSVQQALKLYGT